MEIENICAYASTEYRLISLVSIFLKIATNNTGDQTENSNGFDRVHDIFKFDRIPFHKPDPSARFFYLSRDWSYITKGRQNAPVGSWGKSKILNGKF